MCYNGPRRGRIEIVKRPLQVLAFMLLLAGPQGDKLCPHCETTGRIPNELKQPKLASLEDAVLRCSWRIRRDPAGRALPFIPCRRCLAPRKQAEAQREFDELAADVDTWMDSRAAIDAVDYPGAANHLEEAVRTGGLETADLAQAWMLTGIVKASLGDADLLLQPLAYATANNSILEALACGVPVIGTKGTGLTEVIEDRVNGFLLPIGDTTSMAREALGLLKDKERLATFKYEAGKLSHERFAQEKVVSHYERYYEQVLNG